MQVTTHNIQTTTNSHIQQNNIPEVELPIATLPQEDFSLSDEERQALAAYAGYQSTKAQIEIYLSVEAQAHIKLNDSVEVLAKAAYEANQRAGMDLYKGFAH